MSETPFKSEVYLCTGEAAAQFELRSTLHGPWEMWNSFGVLVETYSAENATDAIDQAECDGYVFP